MTTCFLLSRIAWIRGRSEARAPARRIRRRSPPEKRRASILIGGGRRDPGRDGYAADTVVTSKAGSNGLTRTACGFIAYRNPSPAVAAVVPYQDGIVLVRRRYEPYAGSWSLPSGFMEWGEDPAGTARRETLEETGLEVEIVDLIGAYAGRVS